MRVLITGANGQLGHALMQTAPDDVLLYGASSSELNITDEYVVRSKLDQFKPDLILNAAAYTAVDLAQSNAAQAFAVNRDAARLLAQWSAEHQARLIHVSTDFVFDGMLARPYLPAAQPRPLSVYGQSKWEGEQAVMSTHPSNAVVLRTAWVYGVHGNNFVKTILRLQREREVLKVVADQIGTPTWSDSLARSIWTFANIKAVGIFHFTDAGLASWYDFAVAISEEALALGLLDEIKPIVPISSAEFPLPAPRPACVLLDKFTCWSITGVPPHWRENLREMLKQLK
jgi:dTDP-4-dehydrorhamnose reductase